MFRIKILISLFDLSGADSSLISALFYIKNQTYYYLPYYSLIVALKDHFISL